MKTILRLALVFLGVVAVVFLGNASLASAATAYDIESVIRPFWEGDTVYQESVLVVEEENGSIAPISLLHPIDEIIEVKNAPLSKKYIEGVDYKVQDGKLVVFKTGNILRLTYDEFHPTTGQSGFESANGGYVLWKEGSWYHSRQIVVTYKHSGEYSGYIPEGKGLLLPGTQEKLKGNELNVLVYGDSISCGGNTSGHPMLNVAPFMPIYAELFCEGIKRNYGVETVNLYNPSVGGTDSAWGLSNLRGGVFDKYEKIDLAILAFGMNDVKRDADSYASNMRRMANGLKTKYEGIEIIFVAPMLPNPDAVGFYGNQPGFRYALLENEAEGVVVADITTLHEDMLKVKSYADMTGNNVNHNNDFLGRVYAHALLETLKVSEYGEDIIAGDSSSESTVESSTVENSSSTSDNSEGVESSVVKSSCKASAGAGGMAIILACGMLAIIRKKN